MPVRQKFPPLGCNMNDEGYPFRGEYKMEPPLNHGHTGAARKGTTALVLRITGANLVIEKLQQGKGQTLQCELSVDGGPSRPVVFPLGGGAVPVPGDGREYHLNAVVHGGGMKHHCRMILSGSEGKSVLRLRAPTAQRLVDNIILTVDGKRIFPKRGWYEIPIKAKECFLGVAEMEHPQRLSPELEVTSPPTILVQTTTGDQEGAVLFCSGSGEILQLTPNRPIHVDVASGPFTFQLPRGTGSTQPIMPSGTFTSSYAEPVPTDDSLLRFPELETMTVASAPVADTSPLTFVAKAEGFMIELVGDHGSSVSGYGIARLRLPDKLEHRIGIIIKDIHGRIFLRQNTLVPNTSRGDMPEKVLPSAPHVEPQGPSSFPHPTAAATASVPEPWIVQLGKALQCPDLDTARRGVQGIIAPYPEATTVLGFVSDQLFKAPPIISFKKSNDMLNEIQCPGYGVTAAVDNAPPCAITAGGSIQVPAGRNVTLSAVTLPMGRVVAGCRLQPSPVEQNLDELLVARLLETFRRHSASPEKIMSELANVTFPQSASGHQLLPLILECLRRLINVSQRPIYMNATEMPENAQLFVALDDKRPVELLPHSVMDVSRDSNNIRVSIVHKSTSPGKTVGNPFAKALVDAYYSRSSSPLLDRWSSIPTEGPDERALLDLLLEILRGHENELARQRSQGGASMPLDAIQFTCENGCLKNIRTDRPCRLSADVDGTGYMNIEQGGQIPQGYNFPPGSTHRIHLIARDSVSGAPCAESRVTLIAPEVGDAALRHALGSPASCFLDANLSQLQDEVHLRLVCPQKLRILCDVDGRSSGDNGRSSDLVAKMNAAHPHNVNVRLLDDVGGVVFVQRFTLPPMTAPLWSLGLEHDLLRVDPTAGAEGTIVKASLDRSFERDITAPLPFDSNNPHNILLRRYFMGSSDTLNRCVGELSLRIPSFVNPVYIQDLSRLYRSVHPGGSGELRSRLNELRASIPSNVVKDLISALIDAVAADPRALHRSTSETRIHFRLSGDESSFAR